MFALVITGPPGAGKTEVLIALSDLLVADGIRHASVEVEALTSAHPPLEDSQWTAPVRAVCGLYRDFGYELLLATATVGSQHDLDALRGAGPEELIGAVRPECVLSVADAQLARWQSLTDDAPYAALMVLTACRIWRFSQEQIHCSKSAAGTWALTCDPSLHAIRDALRQRTGDPVAVEPAEIARLLEIVRAHIAIRASDPQTRRSTLRSRRLAGDDRLGTAISRDHVVHGSPLLPWPVKQTSAIGASDARCGR